MGYHCYQQNFYITYQLLIIFFAFVRYWIKKCEYSETEHQIFIEFKKQNDSFRREILYSILIDFVCSKKVVRGDQNVFKRNM
jgi:uncharacterized membrane protein (DUF106 family)